MKSSSKKKKSELAVDDQIERAVLDLESEMHATKQNLSSYRQSFKDKGEEMNGPHDALSVHKDSDKDKAASVMSVSRNASSLLDEVSSPSGLDVKIGDEKVEMN